MKPFDRIIQLILYPISVWDRIKAEQISESDLFSRHMVPVALVPVIAGFLGLIFIGKNFFQSLIWAVLFFVIAIGGIYFFTEVVQFIGKGFKAQTERIVVLQLVAYALTPIYLAGIFFLIPPLYGLSIVGIFGFYLYWIGFQKVINCPEKELFNYSFITLVLFILTVILIYLLPALIGDAAVYQKMIGY